jgi:hypothetical protein
MIIEKIKVINYKIFKEKVIELNDNVKIQNLIKDNL